MNEICIESRDQIWKTWGFRKTLQRWKDKKIDNLNGKKIVKNLHIIGKIKKTTSFFSINHPNQRR